jgi:glycyl-tRNA synthetase beta subunit
MNFLLEIGTEEIPHWMIPSALAQLSKLDLFGATIEVDATPRRLVVRATGLPNRTPDQEQLVKGPPISAGEKAAAGFAKKQGVDPSAMQKVGDYYELRKKIEGREVRDLLAESLPASSTTKSSTSKSPESKPASSPEAIGSSETRKLRSIMPPSTLL